MEVRCRQTESPFVFRSLEATPATFFPAGKMGNDSLIRLDGRRVGRYTLPVRAVVSLPADFNFSGEFVKPFAMKRPNHTARRRKK
jgi:hypothetical protein